MTVPPKIRYSLWGRSFHQPDRNPQEICGSAPDWRTKFAMHASATEQSSNTFPMAQGEKARRVVESGIFGRSVVVAVMQSTDLRHGQD